MLPIRARVFWSGPSQAVRLPKAFRFTTDEVTIRKVGDALVLEPALEEL
jgi:antitoxin VapB